MAELKRGKQLNEYLKTINFGLLDYKKTNEKYKNYKTELWNQIKTSITLKESLNIDFYDWEMHKRIMTCYMSKTLQTTSIRRAKTLINSTIYSMNLRLIGELDYDLNQNEQRSFTVRFYLDNYKKINSLMKRVLVNYVKRFFN